MKFVYSQNFCIDTKQNKKPSYVLLFQVYPFSISQNSVTSSIWYRYHSLSCLSLPVSDRPSCAHISALIPTSTKITDNCFSFLTTKTRMFIEKIWRAVSVQCMINVKCWFQVLLFSFLKLTCACDHISCMSWYMVFLFTVCVPRGKLRLSGDGKPLYSPSHLMSIYWDRQTID